jgi:hypothetical protein
MVGSAWRLSMNKAWDGIGWYRISYTKRKLGRSYSKTLEFWADSSEVLDTVLFDLDINWAEVNDLGACPQGNAEVELESKRLFVLLLIFMVLVFVFLGEKL